MIAFRVSQQMRYGAHLCDDRPHAALRRELSVVSPDWSDRTTVESPLITLAEAMLAETAAAVQCRPRSAVT
jgi:hypothetical protein